MGLMTIDEMRKHRWIVSWSGGKDSTATILLMHKYQIPIDTIVYVRMMWKENIPATLPVMTDFIDNAVNTFKEMGYKCLIKESVPICDITHKVFFKSQDPNRNGKEYGINAFSRGHCKTTGVKQNTIKKVCKELNIDNVYEMIGYAADETERLHRLSDKKQSIMATLGINEKETFDICKEANLLSPLYDLGLSRDGCWFCPNAKKKEKEMIKEQYPWLYAEIEDMAKRTHFPMDNARNCGWNSWLKDEHIFGLINKEDYANEENS